MSKDQTKPKKTFPALEELLKNKLKSRAATEQSSDPENTKNTNTKSENHEEKKARKLKGVIVSKLPDPFINTPDGQKPVIPKPQIDVTASPLFQRIRQERLAQEDAEAAEAAKKTAESIAQDVPKGNITPQQPISELDLSKSVELLSVIGKPRIPPKEQTKQDGAEQRRLSSRRNSKDGPFMG